MTLTKFRVLFFAGLCLSAGLVAPTLWAAKITIKLEGGTYSGRVHEDVPHGRGTMKWDNGSQYVGMFKNGERHGLGRYTHADGSRYVGEFKQDKRHGEGTYTWADGALYTGEYL